MEYVYLYFGDTKDQEPAFGIGFSRVLAFVPPEDAGKRAEVVMLRPSDCSVVSVSRDRFEELLRAPRSKTCDFEPEAMIKRLVKHAGDYDRWSPTVREALLTLGVPEAELPEPLRAAVRAAPVIAADGPVDATLTPYPKEGSGKFIQRLWLAGVCDPDRLVELVLANYPGRTTKRSDVFYNYNLLVKAGVEVTPWPDQGKKRKGKG